MYGPVAAGQRDGQWPVGGDVQGHVAVDVRTPDVEGSRAALGDRARLPIVR